MSHYIEVQEASVIYNEGSDNQVNALTDISLGIDRDEFVVFFGPSGCGKTTLLNLISGLERASRGQVLVDGEDLSRMDTDQMARFHREKIGMVFQAYNLIPSLSIIDNVILPRIFGSLRKDDRKTMALRLLEKFGVAPQADKFPMQLSGGQQQRVAIARSLINDQPIILADEPVGNLDSKSAENVLSLMQDLNRQESKTIIMVTHNADHLAYADHIFYIKDGKITDEVFTHKKKHAALAELKPQEREFELLSRAFSGFSEAQLNVLLTPFKAKALTQYLTDALDFNQSQRMEEFVTEMLSGEMKIDQLVLLLDKPYEKGGAGLNFKTAQKYALAINKLLQHVSMLEIDLTPVVGGLAPAAGRARLVAGMLIEINPGRLSCPQVRAMEKIVADRFEGRVDQQALCAALDAPVAGGGAGIDLRIARKMSRYLEMLLLLKFSRARHHGPEVGRKGAGEDDGELLSAITEKLRRMEDLSSS